jgi:hypothetical protein
MKNTPTSRVMHHFRLALDFASKNLEKNQVWIFANAVKKCIEEGKSNHYAWIYAEWIADGYSEHISTLQAEISEKWHDEIQEIKYSN